MMLTLQRVGLDCVYNGWPSTGGKAQQVWYAGKTGHDGEHAMQQAQDFCDESEALHAVLEPLGAEAYTVPTLFNDWTINDILQHLHHFNIMADLSLNDPDKFVAALTRKFTGDRVPSGNLVRNNAHCSLA